MFLPLPSLAHLLLLGLQSTRNLTETWFHMGDMLFFLQLRCGFSEESKQSWLCTWHRDSLEAVGSTVFLFQHVTNVDLVLVCFTSPGHIPLFIAIIWVALT